MNQASPAVEAIVTELVEAVRRDHRRRMRRRKTMRAGGVSVVAAAGLSTAALAAGGAFKEIETVTPVSEVELPQHVTIQAVDSFAEFVGKASPSGFVTKTGNAHWGHYLYHVTGGEARELGCGTATIPTNNIYITSKRPLTEQEILALLEPDGQLKPLVLPGGEANPGTIRPPWITSTSDGCPNPGIAGQPGSSNQTPTADKAAVKTPASTTTKLLIRTRQRVPIGTPDGATNTTAPTTKAPKAANSAGRIR
jgi:hypothetical protein